MRLSGIIGILMILAGIFSLTYGTIQTKGNLQRVGTIQGKFDKLTAERDTLRTTLFDTNMRYRAHRNGMSSIPDTTRIAQAGILVKKSEAYNKRIRHMEMQETEISRQIRRRQRQKAESMASAKKQAIPFGVGGILLLSLGIVMVARGRNG